MSTPLKPQIPAYLLALHQSPDPIFPHNSPCHPKCSLSSALSLHLAASLPASPPPVPHLALNTTPSTLLPHARPHGRNQHSTQLAHAHLAFDCVAIARDELETHSPQVLPLLCRAPLPCCLPPCVTPSRAPCPTPRPKQTLHLTCPCPQILSDQKPNRRMTPSLPLHCLHLSNTKRKPRKTSGWQRSDFFRA